jgi:hypothetical protein
MADDLAAGPAGDAVKVFVRIRPLDGGSGVKEEVKRCAMLNSPTQLRLDGPNPKTFTFDAVKGEDSTQEELFSAVGKKVVETSMQGYNGECTHTHIRTRHTEKKGRGRNPCSSTFCACALFCLGVRN